MFLAPDATCLEIRRKLSGPPVVTAVEPPHGPRAGGTVILIRGRNFGEVGSLLQATVGDANCDDTRWLSPEVTAWSLFLSWSLMCLYLSVCMHMYVCIVSVCIHLYIPLSFIAVTIAQASVNCDDARWLSPEVTARSLSLFLCTWLSAVLLSTIRVSGLVRAMYERFPWSCCRFFLANCMIRTSAWALSHQTFHR